LLVGAVAENLWGSQRFILLFFSCGILVETLALYWQPVGAGNSGANFGVAAATALLCILSSRTIQIRAWAALVLVSGLILLLMRDIHGAAVMDGVALCVVALKLQHQKVL